MLNQWYEEREKAGHVGFEMLATHGGKKEKQRIRWKVKSDEERESLGKMIGISLYRPFCKSIVVQINIELEYPDPVSSSPPHRAGGLLFLIVDFVQLGCTLLVFYRCPSGFSRQPWIQYTTVSCCFFL